MAPERAPGLVQLGIERAGDRPAMAAASCSYAFGQVFGQVRDMRENAP
jgi:hypothetical protein